MIKHIVCYKLKDNSADIISKVKDTLLSLKGRVPQVIDLNVGEDMMHSSRSYDVALEVVLNSRQDLIDYANDTYHCQVVKAYIHSVVEVSVTVDYEF
ncbi:MAG: Dabb family protein [Clostridia bacterium]|nr:Dabb family protein [Clostridia bacterium]